MRRFSTAIVFFGILAMAAATAPAHAQDGPASGGGGNGGGGQARQGGGGRRGGPAAGFHLIQRFALEKLKLTEDQQKQVADLEKETKAKLYKILTPEQQKTLEAARPPRPGQGGFGGQGGGQGGGRRGQGGGQGGAGGGQGSQGGGQGGPGGAGGEQ